MVEYIEKLHNCADCPIRCRAVARPRSIFARIHRWHATWWPGWRMHQTRLRARGVEAPALASTR
jgi:aldehyde:ferredoxin oxidoreductase